MKRNNNGLRNAVSCMNKFYRQSRRDFYACIRMQSFNFILESNLLLKSGYKVSQASISIARQNGQRGLLTGSLQKSQRYCVVECLFFSIIVKMNSSARNIKMRLNQVFNDKTKRRAITTSHCRIPCSRTPIYCHSISKNNLYINFMELYSISA